MGLIGATHDEDPDIWRDRAQATDERQAAIDIRQAGVEDDDIGAGLADDLEGGLGLAGGADDLEPVTDAQQPAQALPNPVIRIDEDDTNGGTLAGVGLHATMVAATGSASTTDLRR